MLFCIFGREEKTVWEDIEKLKLNSCACVCFVVVREADSLSRVNIFILMFSFLFLVFFKGISRSIYVIYFINFH